MTGSDSHPPAPPAWRLGFAGTPQFAATILAGLIEAGHRPLVVYSQPDRPRGRGRRVAASPVKRLAEAAELPVHQPSSLSGDEAAALAELDLDVLVVAAYGLILPPAVLDAPRLGCINVHASLLPRWRGAAPVERAIMAGDQETGVSIMRMDRGLDTGPVYLERRWPIAADADGPGLEQQLAELGCEALLDCLSQLPGIEPAPQPAEGVTYAHKLTRADAIIDWRRPAAAIERQIRALRGRLPAASETAGIRCAVLEAIALDEPPADAPGTVIGADRRGIRVACGTGTLQITRLQLGIGKGRPLSAADAVNGYAGLFSVGATFAPAPRDRDGGAGAPPP